MSPEMERLDQIEAGPYPGCRCDWCTAARKDNLQSDLSKKYGIAAEVLARLARMD